MIHYVGLQMMPWLHYVCENNRLYIVSQHMHTVLVIRVRVFLVAFGTVDFFQQFL